MQSKLGDVLPMSAVVKPCVLLGCLCAVQAVKELEALHVAAAEQLEGLYEARLALEAERLAQMTAAKDDLELSLKVPGLQCPVICWPCCIIHTHIVIARIMWMLAWNTVQQVSFEQPAMNMKQSAVK